MEEHRLPKMLFSEMVRLNDPWIDEVKAIFGSINCMHTYENECPVINVKEFLGYAKEALTSQYVGLWRTEVPDKPKL